jgi:DNA polymerase-1
VGLGNKAGLALLRKWAKAGVLFVMHNAQYDLPILHKLDIYPERWQCTMLMANLVCDIPRGLKALAYRLCGMQMRTYEEMVSPYNEDRIIPYLEAISDIEWPDPDPVEKIEKGKIKITRPQPLHKRVNRMFKDWESGRLTEFYPRWMNQGQYFHEQAAAFLGPFKPATLADVPFEAALYYACRDTDATSRVYPILYSRVRAMGLEKCLEMDQGIVPMLARMEEVGVGTSEPVLLDLQNRLVKQKRLCEKEIKDRVGYWVNPGSHDQVRELLYKKLKIKPPKRKKDKAEMSTNQDYLETIENLHPVIPRILSYRAADKLKGSFVDRLLVMRDVQGRVHDDISQIRTTTGRLTASIMLLIPRQGDLATELRRCFVAKEGCSFVSADYSQIELRVLAHMSQDKQMLRVYQENGDIHINTACEIFGLTPDRVDKMEHRYPSKAVNFGIAYGLGPDGLYEQLGRYGWTLDRCEWLIREWFRIYYGAGTFMNDVWQHARRYGYVLTMHGRRRLIPEVRSAHTWIRSRGLRAAGNHPIQGSANEIMKIAMGRLTPVLGDMRKEFYVEPLIQIHDDLKLETLTAKIPEVAKAMKVIMENAVKLTVPTPVDIEVGTCWGEMNEYGH